MVIGYKHCWTNIPDFLTQCIFDFFGWETKDSRCFRLVCKSWCTSHDNVLQKIQVQPGHFWDANKPFEEQCSSLLSRLPSLSSLDVLRFRIKHATDFISLEFLALSQHAVLTQRHTLTRLELIDCEGITDETLSSLSRLLSLTSLKVGMSVPNQGCRISGGGISALSELSSLQRLDLTSTRFCLNDSGVASIGKMAYLSSLTLKNFVWNCDATPLGNLPNLAELDLSNCVFTWEKRAAAFLPEMTVLTRLSLESCQGVANYEVMSLSSLRSLKWLILSNTGVSDDGLRLLESLSSLSSLNVSFSGNISDYGLSLLSLATGISRLDLSNLRFVTDSGLSSLSSLVSLVSVNLERCIRVEGVGILSWEGMSSLSKLNLKGCEELSNIGVMAVGRLTSLTSLELEMGTRVSDEGIACLSALEALNSLKLQSGNSVTISVFGPLDSLTSLSHLTLRFWENLNDEGVRLLATCLPSITSLDLTGSCGNISSAGFLELSQMRHLLAIEASSLSNKRLVSLSTIVSLTSIKLNYCPGVNASGVGVLARLPDLTLLDLKYCTTLRLDEICRDLFRNDVKIIF